MNSLFVPRLVRECVVCGERVTLSNATPEWEARHSHAEEPERDDA